MMPMSEMCRGRFITTVVLMAGVVSRMMWMLGICVGIKKKNGDSDVESLCW